MLGILWKITPKETYAPDYSGAVNCLEWQVVYDTRTKIFIWVVSVLSEHLACYSGSHEF
jgi:hypothetical protein